MTETQATYTPRTPSIRITDRPLSDQEKKDVGKAWNEIPANRISNLIRSLDQKLQRSESLTPESRQFYDDIRSVLHKSMGLEILLDQINHNRSGERLMLKFFQEQCAIMRERLLKYETLSELEARNSMTGLSIKINDKRT